jgi:hypothetical protein
MMLLVMGGKTANNPFTIGPRKRVIRGKFNTSER